MHECPRCGQACYCSGDIDDCPVYTEEWVAENCNCSCEQEGEDDMSLDEYNCPHCGAPAGCGHNYGCPDWLSTNEAELARHREENKRLREAGERLFGALDTLMGDSDLPEDDSEEMEACKAWRAALAAEKPAETKEESGT